MQAQVRIFSVFLLLALAAQGFAQPASSTNAEPANTNVQRLIRRFQRATNAALETNQSAAPAAAPVTAAPASSQQSIPALPAPPMRQRRTNLAGTVSSTNVTTAATPGTGPAVATNLNVVGATQTPVAEQS